MTIASNTIVKNGMPFIGKVLSQVAPYMDEMVITMSCESTDGTLEELRKIADLYLGKVKLIFEDVSSPGELTEVRNQQLKVTACEWILFLDDDDFWPQEELEKCLAELGKDQETLAYSVSPYQLIDFSTYDASWKNKSFSKFLRREGLQYIRPWPRDLPADAEGKPLYWKTHSKVKTLPYRFYHLSYLKSSSFREEEWAKAFRQKIGRAEKLEKPLKIW